MNTKELEIELNNAHIRSDSYSLEGVPKDESLILEPSTGNGWRIYYSERGVRTSEKVFLTEEQACECFLEMVLRDPLMKETREQ